MKSRQDIIDLIKKMQSHTVENGATEGEAIAFALKAQKLIADNDITAEELGEELSREVEENDIYIKGAKTWQRFLASVLAPNFRCKSVIRKAYREGRKTPAESIIFIGFWEDTEAAALVFEKLYKVGDKLGKEAACKYFTSHDAYRNFVYGFCKGVQKELEKQCQALALTTPSEVDEYYNGLSLTTARSTARMSLTEAIIGEGMECGRDSVRAGRLCA